MKRLILGLVLPLVLFVVGCKDPYGSCVKASADIGTGIAQGMKTVDGIRQQGLISAAEESSILDYLEFANKADTAFLSCADTAHASTSKSGAFTACAATFNTSLNNPQQLALLRVNNPQASQEVSNIVNGVTAAVNAIIAGLGGK